MKQIAVKDIHFEFDRNNTYEIAKGVAEEKIREDYQEEQDFCKEEYAQLIADGDIADENDYRRYLGITPDCDIQAQYVQMIQDYYSAATENNILPDGVSATAFNEFQTSLSERNITDEESILADFQQLLRESNVITDYTSFRERIKSQEDVDYLLPFEENKGRSDIQKQISDLTSKYMLNIHDLPKETVVEIEDTAVDSKGRASISAVLSAVDKQFGIEGVRATGYEAAKPAEKKDIITQQAYESVKDMMHSKEYQSFLQLRATLQKYSHNNICLIYAQKPDAKAVMGFNAWKKLDRHVDSGQHGIAIWQPCTGIKKSEKAIDDYIEKQKALYPKFYKVMPDGTCPEADKLKEKLMKELNEKGEAEVDFGFKLGTTFDISQTVPNDPTKDNLQEIINLNKPLEANLANYDEVLKSMKEAATLAPFTVATSHKGQQEDVFEALLSYADAVLSSKPESVIGIKSATPLEGDMHKIETVMTAYMISEHIGIETGDKAGLKLAEIFDKGALSREHITIGKREMFMQAFDRAAKLSDMFVKEFDKSFGIDIEAQREAIRKENEEKAAKAAAEKQAYKDSHTKFGRTEVLIADQWKDDKTEFTIGKNEKTNVYFVKTVTDKKSEFIKDDDGKPMKFTEQPDRDTVKLLLENQRGGKAAPAPEVDDKDDADEKKAHHDIDI